MRQGWMARLTPRGALATALLATVVLAIGAGAPRAASAEGFFDWRQPSPVEIQASLARAGFVLRSALVQRGDVYVCDVVAQSGDIERLVIGVRNGQVLERYAARPPAGGAARYVAAPRYPGPGDSAEVEIIPRRYSRVAPLEAPGMAQDAPAAAEESFRPPRPIPTPKRMAKSDGLFPSLFAPPEPAPAPTTEAVKPKLRAHKAKPATPEATPSAATDAPAGSPDAAAAASPATPAPGPVPAAAPVPKTASADAAPEAAEAPAPVADAKPKAKLNDLPVVPLD